MSWFTKPSELFRSDKILVFWPTDKQSSAERINASTRFILYLACVLYLLKRDIRVIVLALLAIGTLFLFSKSGNVKEPGYGFGLGKSDCQAPTSENPLGNVLLTDYTDEPNRPGACWYPTVKPEVEEYLDNTVKFGPARTRSPVAKYQRKAFARQFITGPVSSIPGDQTAFAEWCYGKKWSPQCRNDPKQCDADYWGAQTEAFAGLDPSGDMRTGMRGGMGQGPK
jgi:hypothetical protein